MVKAFHSHRSLPAKHRTYARVSAPFVAAGFPNPRSSGPLCLVCAKHRRAGDAAMRLCALAFACTTYVLVYVQQCLVLSSAAFCRCVGQCQTGACHHQHHQHQQQQPSSLPEALCVRVCAVYARFKSIISDRRGNPYNMCAIIVVVVVVANIIIARRLNFTPLPSRGDAMNRSATTPRAAYRACVCVCALNLSSAGDVRWDRISV